MTKKGAKGSGNIRKKTVKRGGKEYTYWEARITTGRDPGTGKQIQRSFTGKTQKEVREKLQAAAVAVNDGTYTVPARLTLGQWLDIWQREYMGNAKPATLRAYDSHIRNHIRPGLGAVRLTELHPHTVQNFINSLDGLSPTSVRLVYTVLRTALEKAIDLDYIPRNPAAKCVLPKQERKEIKPLDDAQATALIRAAAGTRIENMIPLALFTGLRISELLGLTWSAVDMDRGTITVDKQLSAKPKAGALFSSPKSGKSRTITPAPTAFQVLRRQKARQAEQQLKAGPLWSNPHGLIFTAEDGGPLSQQMAELNFSDVRATVGLEGTRFHDLRHTYAVNSIRAGDDIKTIQTNLGHASAAFTLDIYGHVTEAMKQDSATRMEVLIKSTINL
jgi:integrase